MKDIFIYNPLTWFYLFYALALIVAALWPGRPDRPARPEGGARRRHTRPRQRRD